MWLDRILRRLQGHPGPILIEGGEVYGAPFLIEALGRTQRVAWMHLTPTEASDFVAIGNRLADAVNRALEANFLPHAFPFTYAVEVLKKQLPLVEPLTIVCTNVDYTPLFRASLLDLAATGTKVIMVVNGSVSAFHAGLLLRREELALTPDEAEALAGQYLGSSEAYMLWRSSGGAYLTFMSSACRLRGVPLPNVPSPQGDFLTAETEMLVSPGPLLEVLIKLGRHTEAFELAVMSAPERVAELVGEAGQIYLEEGRLERLHVLLESLDDAYKADEKVLEWRLVSGFEQSNYARLMPIVESHLENNEAPELRARYAGVLAYDFDERFAQAKRAAAAAATPLTLYQLGRLHPDGEEGCKVLRQSVKCAEAFGRPYDIARNAAALANNYAYIGQFQEASSWVEWATKIFDAGNIRSGSRRLWLLEIYALCRIVTGHTQGLREMLAQEERACETAELGIALDIRKIMVMLELESGNAKEAERLALKSFECCPRYRIGESAVLLVRALLEQGKFSEALAKAEYAITLIAGEDEYYVLPASLALGMVHAFINPDAARNHLTNVIEAHDIEAIYRIMAALHLLKAGAVSVTELSPKMQKLLDGLTDSSFRIFCGPANSFTKVRQMLTTSSPPLRIKVLGQDKVWLNDEPIQLSERMLEALVLLALHPEGLTPEMLGQGLYGSDSNKLDALRTTVSRLRSLIPISAHPEPYRITVPFSFDVHECEKAIAEGDVRTALEHYRGPLLSRSDASGINEARLSLEEILRRSVLNSSDVEVLLPLAETLKDDLELWEATYASLPLNDARRPRVRVQLQKISQEFNTVYN